MDIDFSLLLVSLTAIAGFFALLDLVIYRPKRKRAVASYRAECVGSENESVVAALSKEPVWIEYPKSFFPVLLIVLILRSFLIEPFKIPSGSMLPTLRDGDYILVNKFDYGLRLPVLGYEFLSIGEPRRGDVMVFKYPENPRINYIKRVIGLPGDKLSYYDKRLFINGEEVSQTLLAQLPPHRPQFNVLQEALGQSIHTIQTSLRHSLKPGEWEVPEGHFFVMGDNRDNSRDSRTWGFVPDRYIVGRAFAIWMYMPDWVPSFKRNGFIN